MEHISIREILDMVSRGQIRIPAFQRGFVWEPDRVAYLMDSIYKGYPFGALLFWRTNAKLRVERDLGPFTLPSPKVDYPVDYVLDGQQRITSIFGVFQLDLPQKSVEAWQDIYFDLEADASAQETQFFALSAGMVDNKRHIPLKTLFDTSAYRKATAPFDDQTAKRIDDMQAVFKEVRIPLQVIRTENKATVAIIFERVNRQGVPLDTLQLLSAWTWSEDFQLQEQFGDLAEQLAPFGFEEVGADTNLVLRCCSAILSGDASPEALMSLNGALVRERFSEVVNGVRGAIDYLRTHYNVHSLYNLPFSTTLVPLSVFFAAADGKETLYTDEQRKQIDRWFWRTAFSRRYSSGVLRLLKTDIDEIAKLKAGKPSTLGDFPVTLTHDFFLSNDFGMGNVNTKTFVLLLASANPLSFVSGAPIDLGAKLRESNRAEFHHLMPRAFVEAAKDATNSVNCLANFSYISRADNRHLGGVAPSIYKAKMPTNAGDILARALVPASLFADAFDPFVVARADVLHKRALLLCQM